MPARDPDRILVRGVNWLGDAVMTSPALQRLHEHWPQARVTLLTPAKLADLWRHHPHVHEIWPLEKRDGPWVVGRRLRQARFDLGLVLPNSPRSALEVFLGRLPRRIGYARPWRNWLLTEPIPPRRHEIKMRKRTPEEIRSLIADPPGVCQENRAAPPGLIDASHHVFQYLHLVEALGANGDPVAPRMYVTEGEIGEARDLFLGDLALEIPCLGLNPGAEYGPAKRWPPDRFAEAAVRLHRDTGCALILLGGPGDAPITATIRDAIRRTEPAAPVIDVTGQTSLRQLAALLKHCDAVLTNDSGSMHLAAALGTPVVAIFGSTSRELTGPGHPGHADPHLVCLQAEVPCSPCFLRECPIDFRCMTRVEVPDVVTAVLRLLG